MNELAQQMLGITQDVFLLASIVFVRVGALVSVLPAFGEQMIPARVKLGVAIMFTMLVFPTVTLPDTVIGVGPSYVALILSETVIGLMFGLTLRFVSHCLLIAGSIAAQATSLSQLFGGTAVDPQPAMANLIYIAGLALLVLSDLHLKLVWALIELFRLFPIGFLMSPPDILEWGVAAVAKVFALAFVLSAPFVLASLLYNVAMGVINKAMPQLMVAFVGAPAITAAGLALMLLTIPFMLPIWQDRFEAVLASPLQVLP